MRRLGYTLLLVAAVAAALVLTAANGGGGTLKSYEIEVDSAFGLVEGGDLKIGGVKAGETTGFRLQKRPPYRVLVDAEVTEPGFDSLRRDARCDVRQQSLIGEYYVDCDIGSKESAELPDGGRVPVSRTSSTVSLDLINNVMRRPYRERFRLILAELGTGLAGRPDDLNETIRRAHPALRETSETLAILRRQNRTIRDFIRDASTVSREVEPMKEEVARWAREASDTAAIQASRSEELGRYWNRLPSFLRELEPTAAELERTARSQTPTLRKLGAAAPELTRFLGAAEPFARSTRLSIPELGRTASTGRAAIDESTEEIRELRELAPLAPELGKPLRQFLQTIDDRTRSTENDPAARATAPPEPDKTAYRPGQGFTGMEAFWNYIYFQGQAINTFDDLGHLLRIAIFTLGPCSPYTAKPTPQAIERCNGYLGPYQPGVTAPDPTRTNVAAREAAERRSSTAAGRDRPRRAGDPEAPPDPGKPDISKPQITIPQGIRELIANGRARGRDDDSLGNVADLLDFLLAP